MGLFIQIKESEAKQSKGALSWRKSLFSSLNSGFSDQRFAVCGLGVQCWSRVSEWLVGWVDGHVCLTYSLQMKVYVCAFELIWFSLI